MIFKTSLINISNSISKIQALGSVKDGLNGLFDTTTVQQYTLAISGLNKQEAITLLQKQGLSKIQQEQVLSSAGLVVATQNLNAELVEEAILESNISGAKAEAILSELGLIDAKTGNVIVTNKCTQAELAQALATHGIVGADAEAILSQVGLSTANAATTISFEGLTTAIKANIAAMAKWLVTNPIGWCVLAAGAIYGLSKAYDALTVSEEEMAESHNESIEKVNETIKAYEDEKNEIESLQKKYDENKDKLQELYSLRESQSITKAEEEYLDQLEQQNEKLRKQIEYKKAIANQSAQENEKEAVKTLNEKTQNGNANGSVGGSTTYEKITDAEKLKRNTSTIKGLTNSLKDYEDVISGIELSPDRLKIYSDSLDIINKKQRQGAELSQDEIEDKKLYESILSGTLSYEQYEKVVSSTKETIGGLIEKNNELLNNVEPLNDAIVSTTGANYDLKIANDKIIADAKDATISFNEFTNSVNETEDAIQDLQSTIPTINTTQFLSSIQQLSDGFDQMDKIYSDVKDQKEFDWSSILNNDNFTKAFGDMTNVTEEYKNAYDEFIDTVSKSPDNISACQSAFDNLATAYLYNSDKLKDVSEATKQATVNMLEEMGVVNALEVVEYQLAQNDNLAKAKEEQSQACEVLKQSIQSESDAKEVDRLAAIDLANAEQSEIQALFDAAKSAGTSTNALLQLELAKIATNGVAIDTSADIQNLVELANQAELTADKILEIKSLSADFSYYQDAYNQGNWGEYSKFKVRVDKAKKDITSGVETQPKVNYGGGATSNKSSGGGGGGGGKSKSKKEQALEDFNKYVSKLFDWIEVRLSRVQRKIDNAVKRAEFYLENDLYKKSFKQYEKAISQTTKLIKNNQKGSVRYEKQANTVINKAVKEGLISSGQRKDIKKKVAEGTIDIKKYDDATQAVINSYKQFYDKSVSCSDAVVDLSQKLQDYYESLYNIPLEKASDKIEKFNDSISVLGAKLENISVNNYKDANKNLDKQLSLQKKINSSNQDALKETNDNLKSASKSLTKNSNLNKKSGINSKEKKSIKKAVKNGKEVDLTMFKEGTSGYKAAERYNEALKKQAEATQNAALSEQELQKQIRETAKSQFDNAENYYSKQIGLIQNNYDVLNDTIKLLETRGAFITAKYYGDQQKYEREKLKAFEEERKSLLNQMALLEQTPTGKYSEEWYDCNDAIQKVNSSIREVANNLSDLNNKMNNATTELINMFIGVGDCAKKEVNFVADLMRDTEDFDMNHFVTNEGLSRLESYVVNMQVAASQAGTLKNAVEKLQKAYDDGQTSVTIDGFGKYDFSEELSSKEKFLETINNFYDNWQEKIKDTYDYQSKVIDFMRNKLKQELSALQERISLFKEALNQEKSLREYEKNVRNQTQNISSLEKQLVGVSGDNSEEGINKYQSLQKELSDAREQLEETETDKMIQAQQEMLDKLSEEYSASIDALSANTELLLQQGNELLLGNKDIINSIYEEYKNDVGYTEQFNTIDTTIKSLGNNLTDIKDAINGEGENTLIGKLASNANSIITAIKEDNANQNNISSASTPTPQPDPAKTDITNPTTTHMMTTTLPGTNTSPEQDAFNQKADAVFDKSNDNAEEKDKLAYLKSQVESVFANKKYFAKGKKKKASDYETSVNQYLFKKNNGKVLTNAGLKKMREIFDVKNNDIYNALMDLKNVSGNIKNVKGFSTGGIGKITPIGEDGLAWVRNGEGFVAPEHVQPIKDLVNIVPQINDIIKPIAVPDMQRSNTGASIGNITFDIEMNGVNDVETFSKQIREAYCSDDRIRKMIQCDNLMQLKSNPKTYNRNRYR